MGRQPSTPIERTCDGRRKSFCACTKARIAELRRDARATDYDIARRANLWSAYRISVEEYDAMREAQGFMCAVCLRHEDELPRHAGGRPRKDGSPPAESAKLVVDHCHRRRRQPRPALPRDATWVSDHSTTTRNASNGPPPTSEPTRR